MRKQFIFLSLGEAGAVIFAMMFRHWRKFQLVVSILMILPAGLWFVLPESPRWLIAQGRFKEAQEEVKKAAVKNKAILSPNVFNLESNQEETKIISR